MKRLALVLLLLAIAWPVDAARRMVTPEICGNRIDDDHNGLVDDNCPADDAFETIANGLSANMANARTAGSATTASSTESSSGSFLANTSNFRNGQWALYGNYTGTLHPWAKVRVPQTGNQSQNRVWVKDDGPYTHNVLNDSMTIVSAIGLDPPPSFSWVKLTGSFTFAGDFILYGLNTDRVELDCFALVESSSSDVQVALPECPLEVAPATVEWVATGSGTTTGVNATSLSTTINVGSGSGRLLHCALSHRDGVIDSISSVASNVDGALDLLDWRSISIVGSGMWYKINPTAGSHTVTVTFFPQAQNAAFNCAAFTGTHSTQPYGNVAFRTGNTNLSLDVAGSPGQLAIDHVSVSIAESNALTPTSGQQELWTESVGLSDFTNRKSAAYTKPGDSNVNFAYTLGTSSSNSNWVHQAVMLRPPSSEGAVPTLGAPEVVSVGGTFATVRASVNDPSASCQGRRGPTGGPYTQGSTATVGTTGGFCVNEFTGLSEGTEYFFVIDGTNDQGTGTSAQGTFDTSVAAPSITALGITQGEIDQWIIRTTKGPYRVTGDAGSLSPGDWTRIVNNKNTFMASVNDSTANVWNGYTGTGCTPRDSSLSPGQNVAINLRDAGFYALVLNDSTVRTKVRDALLVQAGKSGTNYSNGSKWCLDPANWVGHTHPAFPASETHTRQLLAYDYIRHQIDSTSRATLDTWFQNAAIYFRQNVHLGMISTLYGGSAPSFINGTLSSSGVTRSNNCSGFGQTHISGNNLCEISGWFNNRAAHQNTFFGMVGAMFSMTNEIAWSKAYFREYIKYNIYPDSTMQELNRSHGTNAALGWQYSSGTFGKMILLADTLARKGDKSLYEFSTTAGGGMAGGPKSIRTVANFIRATDQNTLVIYNWNTSATVANQLNAVWYQTNFYANDSYLALINRFFNDAGYKNAYMSIGPVDKQGTSSVRDSDFGFMGPGKVLPGMLFMHGQMEHIQVFP